MEDEEFKGYVKGTLEAMHDTIKNMRENMDKQHTNLASDMRHKLDVIDRRILAVVKDFKAHKQDKGAHGLEVLRYKANGLITAIGVVALWGFYKLVDFLTGK